MMRRAYRSRSRDSLYPTAHQFYPSCRELPLDSAYKDHWSVFWDADHLTSNGRTVCATGERMGDWGLRE